jgi:hypothetical protein
MRRLHLRAEISHQENPGPLGRPQSAADAKVGDPERSHPSEQDELVSPPAHGHFQQPGAVTHPAIGGTPRVGVLSPGLQPFARTNAPAVKFIDSAVADHLVSPEG